MAVKLTTARVDQKEVQGLIAGIKVVSTPEFAEEAFDVKKVGKDVLKHLKRIFPKSKRSYPYGMDDYRERGHLREGWTIFPHPPKGFSRNPGFTVRRLNSSASDHITIASLDQGSRAYSRLIAAGKKTAFLKTNVNRAFPQKIGDTVYLTGNGEIFHYPARNGLRFMDSTYLKALELVAIGETKFTSKVRTRLKQSAR